MRSRTGLPCRATRRAAAAAVLLLGLAACGAGPDSQASGPQRYVALGDSYTSGPGIAPARGAGCLRSGVNYPALVALALDVPDFEDVSCGGATTANLVTVQDVSNRPAPQLDAVTSETELVTIGIGLNDLQLSYGLLYACLTRVGTPTQGCERMIDMPQAQLDQILEAAAGRVEAALEAVQEKAPEARVILVGYPRIVPDSGSCPDRLPMPDAMIDRTRQALERINDLWKKAADAEGADYVDMYRASGDRDICAADPWVNGATDVPDEAASMHPFASYHRAVAKKIVALLEK